MATYLIWRHISYKLTSGALKGDISCLQCLSGHFGLEGMKILMAPFEFLTYFWKSWPCSGMPTDIVPASTFAVIGVECAESSSQLVQLSSANVAIWEKCHHWEKMSPLVFLLIKFHILTYHHDHRLPFCPAYSTKWLVTALIALNLENVWAEIWMRLLHQIWSLRFFREHS